ncbi:MAG: aromatic ring-hydroxylating dioxygenase subunit alpha [Pseudomonadota bacterium]
MEQEWKSLWPRVWLIAGPVCDVREPGDFFTFDIGHESFVITRTDAGEVKAFYNVCPHRGNRLVQEDFGCVPQFTCSFHSWQFGLDGQNVQVTDRETFRSEVLAHGCDLTSVRCEVAGGLVFINMDGEAPPLREYLGVVADHLDVYEIEKMHVIRHVSSEWAANWKTGVDAFYETYHLHAVHPETQCCMEDYFVQYDAFPNGMTRMYIPFARPSPRFPDQESVNEGVQMMIRDAGLDPASFDGPVQDVREALQKAKRERAARIGLDYSKFTDGQLTDSVPYGVFPNVQIGCHPEGVFLMRFLPHPKDPEVFYYDNITLFRSAPDPDYTVPAWMGVPEDTDTSGAIRPDIERTPLGEQPNLGLVLDQDSFLLPVVQKGVKSRGFKGPLWGEQELRLRHYHAELDRYIGGEK